MYLYVTYITVAILSAILCVKSFMHVKVTTNLWFLAHEHQQTWIFIAGNNTLKQCRSDHCQFCVYGTHYDPKVYEWGNVVVSLLSHTHDSGHQSTKLCTNEHRRWHNLLQVQLCHQHENQWWHMHYCSCTELLQHEPMWDVTEHIWAYLRKYCTYSLLYICRLIL